MICGCLSLGALSALPLAHTPPQAPVQQNGGEVKFVAFRSHSFSESNVECLELFSVNLCTSNGSQYSLLF